MEIGVEIGGRGSWGGFCGGFWVWILGVDSVVGLGWMLGWYMGGIWVILFEWYLGWILGVGWVLCGFVVVLW